MKQIINSTKYHDNFGKLSWLLPVVTKKTKTNTDYLWVCKEYSMVSDRYRLHLIKGDIGLDSGIYLLNRLTKSFIELEYCENQKELSPAPNWGNVLCIDLKNFKVKKDYDSTGLLLNDTKNDNFDIEYCKLIRKLNQLSREDLSAFSYKQIQDILSSENSFELIVEKEFNKSSVIHFISCSYFVTVMPLNYK